MTAINTALPDYRLPAHRRELFDYFYDFALAHRSHPGGVYYVLPYLADHLGWDDEQRAWAAWINGNTQNPVTTLMLMEAGDRPHKADAMLNFFSDHQGELAWDTDRRYHRKGFVDATLGYLSATGGNQVGYWRRAVKGGWGTCWASARRLPRMGRLSAWSYLEYLRILGLGVPDASTLMLGDLAGSRSHRNGLMLVAGRESLMEWRHNPAFDARKGHHPQTIAWAEGFGEGLLQAARDRNPGNPDVGYLTLESALCTFKSWHVPNRRYPGVYNDMLYDRLKSAEARFGQRFGLIWDARMASLPLCLRMEHTLGDPGAVPVKQNWFINTGQPIVLGHRWRELWSDFDTKVITDGFASERKWT